MGTPSFKHILFLGCVICELFIAQASFAKNSKKVSASNQVVFSPSWVKNVKKDTARNESYFTENKLPVFDFRELNTSIFDPSFARNMRMQYDLYQDQKEYRERSGLVSVWNQQDYSAEESKMGTSALSQALDFRVTKEITKAEESSAEMKTFKKAAGQVGSNSQLTAKSAPSKPKSFKFEYGAQTDVPGRRAKLWVNQDLFDTSFDYVQGSPFDLGPLGNLPGLSSRIYDYTGLNRNALDRANNERYRVGVTRQLPFSVTSGFVYGFSSTTATLYFTKQLTKQLRAEVASSGSQAMAREQVLRFTYGLTF